MNGSLLNPVPTTVGRFAGDVNCAATVLNASLSANYTPRIACNDGIPHFASTADVYHPSNSGAPGWNVLNLILTTPPAKVLSGEPTEKFSIITVPPA